MTDVRRADELAPTAEKDDPFIEIQRRVQRLEEVQEVHAFVAEFCAVVDTLGPASRLLPFFAQDAVLINDARLQGRSEVLGHYASFFASGVTYARHLPINAVVSIEQSGVAEYRSSFIAAIGYGGTSMFAFGNYVDRIERHDGRWAFVEKGNTISRVVKVPGSRTAAPSRDA